MDFNRKFLLKIQFFRLKIMYLWVSWKEKIWNFFLHPQSHWRKESDPELDSGSFSQRCGSGSAIKCHWSPTLLISVTSLGVACPNFSTTSHAPYSSICRPYQIHVAYIKHILDQPLVPLTTLRPIPILYPSFWFRHWSSLTDSHRPASNTSLPWSFTMYSATHPPICAT